MVLKEFVKNYMVCVNSGLTDPDTCDSSCMSEKLVLGYISVTQCSVRFPLLNIISFSVWWIYVKNKLIIFLHIITSHFSHVILWINVVTYHNRFVIFCQQFYQWDTCLHLFLLFQKNRKFGGHARLVSSHWIADY